ncbi:hypothetical protein J1605_002360 [Eschrichtius robustus]|uniref:Uncharacterized protein n=1 Tax=Eschrichtius robustus TaxID=9764 RepID=A0AB34HWV4_ESCRO|nr:hypothetical protein J1605_002360 [Eschrichtius robustus]
MKFPVAFGADVTCRWHAAAWPERWIPGVQPWARESALAVQQARRQQVKGAGRLGPGPRYVRPVQGRPGSALRFGAEITSQAIGHRQE